MFSEGRERVHWEQMGWFALLHPFGTFNYTKWKIDITHSFFFSFLFDHITQKFCARLSFPVHQICRNSTFWSFGGIFCFCFLFLVQFKRFLELYFLCMTLFIVEFCPKKIDRLSLAGNFIASNLTPTLNRFNVKSHFFGICFVLIFVLLI